MLDVLLKQKGISLYQLEKKSGLSHSTLNDLYHERIDINKCSVITLKKIADVLNMSLDKLYKFLNYDDLSCFVVDKEFDLYKSNMCHELKRITPKEFLKKYLTKDEVRILYKQEKYQKSFYLLSMIDKLCKEININLIKEYKDIREEKLDKISVSESVYYQLKTKNKKFDDIISTCEKDFYLHNIIEGEIENVY